MPNSPKNFIVQPENKKERLDSFLAKQADISRVQAKKAIEAELCLVNGQTTKADYKVRIDDNISYSPLIITNELEAEEGSLNILYQDKDYVIIDKPPNLTVHPAPSQETGTLVHILLSHFPQIREMEGLRPGIVHRIDKDTSGILVIALHEKARRLLSDLFTNREIKKEYLALVHNIPKEEDIIELPIGRHESQKTKMAVKKNGKYALTEYKRIFVDVEKNYALLAVRIHTGRTHQIRVHLSHSGFPLWGDKTYTARLIQEVPQALQYIAQRQMLHAWKIQFIQPITKKEINITCPIPEDMENCLARLKEKTQRYIITGNIASGKSTTLNILKEEGFNTFSADEYVKTLYGKDGAATFLLRRIFGEELAPQNKGVNKEILLKLLKDKIEKEKIENIIHSLVYQAMLEFFANCEQRGIKKAFAEVPLFFENKNFIIDKEKYKVITVWVEEKVRQERLESRNWTQEKIDFLESQQLNIEDKKQKSDILIENSRSLEDLKKKVKSLFLNSNF